MEPAGQTADMQLSERPNVLSGGQLTLLAVNWHYLVADGDGTYRALTTSKNYWRTVMATRNGSSFMLNRTHNSYLAGYVLLLMILICYALPLNAGMKISTWCDKNSEHCLGHKNNWASAHISSSGASEEVATFDAMQGSCTDPTSQQQNPENALLDTQAKSYVHCLVSKKKFLSTITFLGSIREMVEQDVWLSRVQGGALFALGHTEQALMALERSFALDPTDLDTVAALAQVLYFRALQLSPDQADLREHHFGSECRRQNANGLSPVEAVDLTQFYIDRSRELSAYLLERETDELTLIHIRYHVTSLDILEGLNPQAEIDNIIKDLRVYSGRAEMEESAKEMLASILANESNRQAVLENPRKAIQLARLAVRAAPNAAVAREVRSMTAHITGDDSVQSYFELISTPPCNVLLEE